MVSTQRGGCTRKPSSHFGTPVGDVKGHNEQKLVKYARRVCPCPACWTTLCVHEHMRDCMYAFMSRHQCATACFLVALYEYPAGFLRV